VNVVATRGGGFVSGLKRDAFLVKEDGVEQAIEFFGAEDTTFAAAILLDRSMSMAFKFSLARAAAARFAEAVRPQDRVAVFLFGSEVQRVQDFTPGKSDIADAIWDSEPKGNTKMYDAVVSAAGALAVRPEPRRAVLLISDGADFGSSANFDTAVRKVLRAGVTVYAVDLAPAGGRSTLSASMAVQGSMTLRGLAERSGGRYFASPGGSNLNEAFEQIVEEMSHQYTLGYYPTNTRRDGKWRKISVSIKGAGVDVRARPGYQAPVD
jgi:Ca-activated chloride channel family protein